MTYARPLFTLAASLGLLSALIFAALAPASPSTRHLTRIYRGDDGSALYTRQVGSTLYGFGEHPGTRLAFVLRGTVVGSAVEDVKWWGVPKGGISSSGSLELRWSQSGARLVRITPGDELPAIWQAISSSGIAWPNKLVASFQNPSQKDLTGAFAGGGARLYVSERTVTSGQVSQQEVVGVVEKDSQPGERPGLVSVFVGTRNGDVVTGSYAEVPKGVTASRQGTFSLSVGPNRRLTASGLIGRSATVDPDYALDFGVFAKRIEEKLSGTRSVGWSFAIVQAGTIIRRQAGGQRLLSTNGGPKAFTTKTQSQAASTSKTLSAAVLMKVLTERGVSVDAKVAPYLPSCWVKGRGVDTLTFRELLAHKTGFDDSFQSCDDPYECLRKAIEIGEKRRRPAYQNINYALLRAIVPLVDNPTETRHVFENDECKNTNNGINVFISGRFAQRLAKMLEPHGVSFAFFPSGNDDFACVYDNLSRRKAGKCPRSDFALRAGAGWLAISAVDYVKFLSALDRGLIVPKSTAEAMKTGLLGFDSTKKGVAGSYVWKNGGCPGSSTGIGCSALAMIFPGNVQAYAMTNSGRNAAGATSTTLDDTLQTAFDAAIK